MNRLNSNEQYEKLELMQRTSPTSPLKGAREGKPFQRMAIGRYRFLSALF
jgi:hypothetical protein